MGNKTPTQKPTQAPVDKREFIKAIQHCPHMNEFLKLTQQQRCEIGMQAMEKVFQKIDNKHKAGFSIDEFVSTYGKIAHQIQRPEGPSTPRAKSPRGGKSPRLGAAEKKLQLQAASDQQEPGEGIGAASKGPANLACRMTVSAKARCTARENTTQRGKERFGTAACYGSADNGEGVKDSSTKKMEKSFRINTGPGGLEASCLLHGERVKFYPQRAGNDVSDKIIEQLS